MTSTSDKFLKTKNMLDICKLNVGISKLLIQYKPGTYYVQITGDANLCFYIFVSLFVSLSLVCLGLCV